MLPDKLQKYLSFTMNNKLRFIESFQFLISSLDSLVTDLGNDDFKFLSEKFNNNILGLVKQKSFYTFEYMSDFEEFKEELPSKGRFYSSLANRKITDEEYEHVLNVWNSFEMKPMKDYHDLYLKFDVLLFISQKVRKIWK